MMGIILFIMLWWSSLMVVDGIDVRECRPIYTTPREVCDPKIKECWEEHRVKMKWVGPGCRTDEGQALGDGGCQCDQVSFARALRFFKLN
jgi:hypothetical protein